MIGNTETDDRNTETDDRSTETGDRNTEADDRNTETGDWNTDAEDREHRYGNAMDQYVVKDGKKMRKGYTTGSCAAAASKAAALMLLTQSPVDQVRITTPGGEVLDLEVHDARISSDQARCAVRKDGGDDPDVTTGALIYADVSFSDHEGIVIDGGKGVGRVTKPGLDQPVGNAAINSVPRRMITEGITAVCEANGYRGGLSVVISVPEGETIAKRTFNSSLGILGGISIIGTTGIVEPMSEKALTDTTRVTLSQRKAEGECYALLTPGNYGEEFIRENMEDVMKKAVQTSNFIGEAIDACGSLGFKGFLLVGHLGKLVKIAGGMLNTHSKYGDCRLDIMAATAGACGLDTNGISQILDSVMVDEAVRILDEAGLREQTMRMLTDRIMKILKRRAGEETECGVMIFSKVYGLLAESENARELIQKMKG